MKDRTRGALLKGIALDDYEGMARMFIGEMESEVYLSPYADDIYFLAWMFRAVAESARANPTPTERGKP